MKKFFRRRSHQQPKALAEPASPAPAVAVAELSGHAEPIEDVPVEAAVDMGLVDPSEAHSRDSTPHVHELADSPLREAYEKYDKNKSGMIEVDELKAVFSDLGLLSQQTPEEADAFVLSQFVGADADRDSALSFDEFASCYAKVTAPKLLDVLSEEPEQLEQLKAVFLSFVTFGSRQQQQEEMDGARFMKLCRESGLVGGPSVTPSDVDLVFAKAKEKTARRLDFAQFLDALALVADRRGEAVGEVLDAVLHCGGPVLNTTVADAVAGGDVSMGSATAAAVHSPASTPQLVTPSASYVEAQAAAAAAAGPEGVGGRSAGGGARRGSTQGSSSTASAVASPPCPVSGLGSDPEKAQAPRRLRDTFQAFASFGVGSSTGAGAGGPGAGNKLEMDSKQFAKLCRQAGVMDGRLNSTDVDLVFTKARGRGSRKLPYSSFLAAVELLAGKKGVSVAELAETLAACGQPGLHNVTSPEAVRLHDDKSTYTGVYKAGGPSNSGLTPEKLSNIHARVFNMNASPHGV